MAELVKWLRESEARLPVIRTHGDFHLGRTARTDQGWVVSDSAPGGVLPEVRTRPAHPLADVADLLWSMHQASTVAAAERDPAGRLGLAAFGQAWETRNRRAFVTGYLGTPASGAWSDPIGTWCGGLCPFLELARSVRTPPRPRAPGRRP